MNADGSSAVASPLQQKDEGAADPMHADGAPDSAAVLEGPEAELEQSAPQTDFVVKSRSLKSGSDGDSTNETVGTMGRKKTMSRAFMIAQLKSRGTKGGLASMNKSQLEALLEETAPPGDKRTGGEKLPNELEPDDQGGTIAASSSDRLKLAVAFLFIKAAKQQHMSAFEWWQNQREILLHRREDAECTAVSTLLSRQELQYKVSI
jgi:hypothetical protein